MRTLANAEEDLQIAEAENDNLREALKVALGLALAAGKEDVVAEVGRMIARSIDDGGVTADRREEREAERWKLLLVGQLLKQVAESLEAGKDGMFRICKGLPKDWPTQALQAAMAIAEHEPGKPVMLTAREMAERAAKSSAFKR